MVNNQVSKFACLVRTGWTTYHFEFYVFKRNIFFFIFYRWRNNNIIAWQVWHFCYIVDILCSVQRFWLNKSVIFAWKFNPDNVFGACTIVCINLNCYNIVAHFRQNQVCCILICFQSCILSPKWRIYIAQNICSTLDIFYQKFKIFGFFYLDTLLCLIITEHHKSLRYVLFLASILRKYGYFLAVCWDVWRKFFGKI